LRCNLHFHALVLDGVYAPKAGGEPEFFPLRAPETSDVLKVVERVAQAVPAMLKRRGLEQGDGDGEDSINPCAGPWLAESMLPRHGGSQRGQRRGAAWRRGNRIDPQEMESLSSERCARMSGFGLRECPCLQDRARLED
jgi:hypothetical protein